MKEAALDEDKKLLMPSEGGELVLGTGSNAR